MPKGLKQTSSPIAVSARLVESAANTYTEEEIDLTLTALDNEVFVVTQINIDVDAPDSVTATTTGVSACISTTSRATMGTIADNNVLGSAAKLIVCNAGMTADGGIPFDREDPLFAALDQDYLGIVATSNMHLSIQGINNGSAKVVAARVYGYRAQADASVYAALVQSEVLSA